MKQIDTAVLIVGGGPTGLTAGLLLSRLGIDHRIIDQRPGGRRAPAAHVVNARTFEIWRQAGVNLPTLLAAARDPSDAGAVYWVSCLGGEVLGRLPYERQGDEVLAYTPTPLRNLSQHLLEPLLRDAVVSAGCDLAHGRQWQSAECGAAGVISRVRDLASGESYEVRSRYVIAADGAGSAVREAFGIQSIGPECLQSFVMIHFEANLRELVGACPGVLYWVADPECHGAFVAHDIDREWVFMHAWDSQHESIDRYDAAHCEAIVRRAMARRDVSLAIRTISPWVMTSQIAARYRDGRIFLAGDAAHRFPPTGGLGLNTGVQDVHNLAWKIAAVERGWADARLLDTYERERRPIAQYNAEQSLQNAVRLLEVPQAIGISDDPGVARQLFAAALSDPVKRQAVAAAIANQAEHFDMLGLQLGYAYEAGALLPDGTPRPSPANPVRELVPSCRPGARLAHAWVVAGGRRLSTLDLIAPDRCTLLVGSQGAAWSEAALRTGVPIRSVRIGAEVGDAERWWSGVAEITPTGALLVRPDQHIAYRSRRGVADPRAELERALAAITHPDPAPPPADSA